MSTPETGWQPIETAPKDGEAVLLCNDVLGCMFVGYWWVGSHVGWSGWVDGDLSRVSPSHWLPTPPIPKLSA